MKRVTALALALSLLSPAALSAQKPKKPKGNPQTQERRIAVVFSDTQREAVHGFFVQQHGRGNCPPGLAKKQNGCLPPGLAKKRYSVGYPLAQGVVLAKLPAELAARLGPAPRGYRYGILDGDLIKLAIGTLLVVDAIDGLVR